MTDDRIAQLVVIALIVPLAMFGVRFHRKQNSGALGGAMSRAKAYWLPFAIWLWFVLCPAVGLAHDVAPGPARALTVFGVFMWLRGAAEMIMLYVTKNWRPPIGISHDVLCILVVAGVALTGMPLDSTTITSESAWLIGLCALVVVSLFVEIHHAYSFHAAVKGRTTGEDGVWFADDEHEHFKRINRNTRVWNAILTTGAATFVAHWVLS